MNEREPEELNEAPELDPEAVAEALEIDLADVIAAMEETERELGLERVAPSARLNRQRRRSIDKEIKRVTRHPRGYKTLEHPVLKSLTPWGIKELKRRRARAKMARATRKAQQRQAAVKRRRRQKVSNRRRST